MSSNPSTDYIQLICLEEPEFGNVLERRNWDMIRRGLIELPLTADEIGETEAAVRRVRSKFKAIRDASASTLEETFQDAVVLSPTDTVFSEDLGSEATDVEVVDGPEQPGNLKPDKDYNVMLHRAEVSGRRLPRLATASGLASNRQHSAIGLLAELTPVITTTSLKLLGYNLRLEFGKDESLGLLADTGGGSTWVLGKLYEVLQWREDKGTWQAYPSVAEAVGQSTVDDLWHSTVSQHVHLYSGGLAPDVPKAELVYRDKSHTWAILPPDPTFFTFENTFCFDEAKSWSVNVSAAYRFGIAYAVSATEDYHPIEGNLGLSLDDFQVGYPGATSSNMPSFMLALKHKFKAVPQEGGFVLYFGLRKCGYTAPATAPQDPLEYIRGSWIGINKFPVSSADSEWSLPIPVVPFSTGQFKFWTLRLMEVYMVPRGHAPTERMVTGSKLEFGPDGILVDLDSGSSLSWVPAKLVRHLRRAVFHTTAGNLAIDDEREDRATVRKGVTAEYYVSAQDREAMPQIAMVFKGQGSGRVIVAVDTDPFLCTEDLTQVNPALQAVYPGLLVVADSAIINDYTHYTLGMNFFQALFIAMHKPQRSGLRPYVRFKAQSPDIQPRLETV